MAYVELHDGIIINLNNLNSISLVSDKPAGNLDKKWVANVGTQNIQITDGEYSTIKTILGNQLY